MRTQIVRQPAMSANGDTLATMETFAREAFRPWADAFDQWRDSVEDAMSRAERMTKPKDGCGCSCPDDDCQPDACQCTCCVADSDLVVEARVGEQRVIPVVIENKWRRKREIEVQLSDWSCGGSDLQIDARIVDPLKFTIEPCGEHKLMLILAIRGVGDQSDATGTTARPPQDVESCVVCYADLRIKGCDIRPIRIAVAVLPCECGAYRVDCCQACC